MVDERVTRLTEQLLASGLRYTPQRQMVLEVLVAQPGHITADTVLAAVQARYPHVNKTTVYRTLETLGQQGLVAVIHQGGRSDVYELRESRHHHLRCNVCDAELEVPDSVLDPLRARVQQEYGFVPCFDHFALVGVCPACQATGSTAVDSAPSNAGF